jgi:hypothetical protein
LEYKRLNAIINDWAVIIKFRFFIVSHNISPILYPSAFSYQLSGETELKIDIKIEILHPAPVEKLCIEQLLFGNEDGGRNHAFNMYEKEGRRLRKSTVNDTSPGHPIKYVGNRKSGLHSIKDYKSIFFNLCIGFCISGAIVGCIFAFQKRE